MALKFVTGTETTKQTLNPDAWGNGDQLFVASSGNLLVDGLAVEVAANSAKAVVKGAIYSTGTAIETQNADYDWTYYWGAAPEFSGFRLTVDAGGLVAGDYQAVNVIGDGTVIANAGMIAGSYAINLRGDNVSVSNTAQITGVGSAVSISGDNAIVRNHGVIEATGTNSWWSEGIYLAGFGGLVENSGSISSHGTAVGLGLDGTLVNSGTIQGGDATYAAVSVGGDSRVINSGTIGNGGGEALFVSGHASASPASFELVNTGTIAGDGNAIRLFQNYYGSVVTANIVNQGNILGNVLLHDGNDSYDGRLGTLNGFLDAGGGNDIVLGGAGDETVNGGAGMDEIKAGDGDDAVHGGAGGDNMAGGLGTDLLMYNLSSAGVTVNLVRGVGWGGDAAGDRFSGFENVWGSNHADRLIGDAGDNQLAGLGGNDTLNGGAGNDEILGGLGDDVLRGGDGDDLIEGGQGRDNLYGEAGADIFRWRDVTDSGAAGPARDIVHDFVQGEDLFDLALIDAGAAAGDQAFTFRGSAGFTGAGGELRYWQSGGNTIVAVDLDGDKAIDMAFTVLGLHTLTTDDFVL